VVLVAVVPQGSGAAEQRHGCRRTSDMSCHLSPSRLALMPPAKKYLKKNIPLSKENIFFIILGRQICD
jgi:hypothetical protein